MSLALGKPWGRQACAVNTKSQTHHVPHKYTDTLHQDLGSSHPMHHAIPAFPLARPSQLFPPHLPRAVTQPASRDACRAPARIP